MLRTPTRELSREEILSDSIQTLLADMRFTLEKKKYGVGLAAPQVGQSVAISVIGIKPTPTRPESPVINMTIINPKIVRTYGRQEPMWEGCVSFGDTRNFPYAQVPRYKKLRLQYVDESARLHERDFEGLLAHVLQHEVDHLQGILFVDRVEDATSYMTTAEYKKRLAK